MNKTQVLRSIDKRDRVGDEGVYDLLTTGRKDGSGAFIEGVGLRPSQAMVIVGFITDNPRIKSRLHMIGHLETTVLSPGDDNCGWTAWDELLAMPVNDDETWRDNGRPANIAWAVDDLIEAMKNGD